MSTSASPRARCAAPVSYRGINVLMLWSAAIENGYAAPIWPTFKQALELKAFVYKGEKGTLVVYADMIVRTETDAGTGEERQPAPRIGLRHRRPANESMPQSLARPAEPLLIQINRELL